MRQNWRGERKYALLYVVLLIYLSISGCTSLEAPRAETVVSWQGAREHLAGGQKALAQHNYQASLQEFELALYLSAGKPPADEALFHLGMAYIDPENPKRDCSKSITSFQRLAREYPQSPWAEPARIWTVTLKEQEALRQGVSEARQESEKLKRLSNEAALENQRLKQIAKQSRLVDAEIERKKKDQGL
jgi:outer membrane protein assembly factor BamD (BamD/ComL family)